MKQIGIIVQARTGSTRLPGKMVLPFYKGKSILELILERFKEQHHLVLATTTAKNDTVLAELGETVGVDVYRGSEANVLSRFIEAGEKYQMDTIVRICADNPFVNLELFDELLKAYNGEDYLSFRYENGKPTILGHLGLFCEITTLQTLKEVQKRTKDNLYQEHVTNFIYNNSEIFNVRLIDLPKKLHSYEGIRLTVDTKEDFKITQDLYAQFGTSSTIDKAQEMIDHIGSNMLLLSTMRQEIELNSK